MTEDIVFRQKPTLKRPYLVVGFSGWLDGGQASTGTVSYLVRKLKAKQFAEIQASDFTVYQIPGMTLLRPQIEIENGIVKEVRFWQNEFFYWQNESSPQAHDLVLLVGTEPSLRWQRYTDNILSLAKELAVERVFSVGGVLDRVPHTREPIVSCTVTDAKLKDELSKLAVRFTDYDGPATFNSVLVNYCKVNGIEAIHMTGRATYYPEFDITIPRNPKTIMAILKRLDKFLGTGVDLVELGVESEKLEQKLNSMLAENQQLQAYVRELERAYVEPKLEEEIEAPPEEFIKGVEDFLRDQRREDKEDNQ